MLKAVVGHSNDPDTEAAIAEVLEQCLTDLAGISPKAGILLAAPDFEHSEILRAIYQTFPELQLIGGTTDGEISSVLAFQQDSLVLLLLCSDDIEFHAAVGRQISSDPVAIARQTVQTARYSAQHPINLCVATPESLTTSGLLILQGLQQALGPEIPIIGGTTCDQWQFQQTYQFFNREVLSDALPILLLSGPVLWGHGVSSGWTPVGKKGTVTKVTGNVLHEIDGQPALFSCTGRLHVLGTRAKEEYQVLQPEMPAGVTCAGFYTYGEIAPLRVNGEAQFHNETFVTLLLGVE